MQCGIQVGKKEPHGENLIEIGDEVCDCLISEFSPTAPSQNEEVVVEMQSAAADLFAGELIGLR